MNFLTSNSLLRKCYLSFKFILERYSVIYRINNVFNVTNNNVFILWLLKSLYKLQFLTQKTKLNQTNKSNTKEYNQNFKTKLLLH